MKPEPLQPSPEEAPELSAEERALAQRLADLRDMRPSETYRRRAAALLQERIAAESGPALAPTRVALPRRRTRSPRGWAVMAMRLTLVGAALVLSLLGVGYVAAQSLPGEALYPVKRQLEEAQVTLSSPASQDELRLRLADRRLAELQRLVERAAPSDQIARAAAEYRSALAQIRDGADDQRLLTVHIGVLGVLLDVAAPEARPPLASALEQAAALLRVAPPNHERPTPPSTATPRPAPSATARPRSTAPATRVPAAPVVTALATPGSPTAPSARPTDQPQPTEPPAATPQPGNVTETERQPTRPPRPRQPTPTEVRAPEPTTPPASNEPTRPPQPGQPEPSRVPEPGEPEPTRVPLPQSPTVPSEPRDPEPTRVPSPPSPTEPSQLRTPEPPRVPEPSPTEPPRVPEPTRPSEPRAPDPSRVPEPSPTEPPRQPEPSRVPERSQPPEPTQLPEPTRAA
ncbi:MAG TPA: DUF5667 domain-containing protein [Roseiflexaceae bacterium]|nr:DUF5667 domain-containing protein [Roseiflexaceae bacterium]